MKIVSENLLFTACGISIISRYTMRLLCFFISKKLENKFLYGSLEIRAPTSLLCLVLLTTGWICDSQMLWTKPRRKVDFKLFKTYALNREQEHQSALPYLIKFLLFVNLEYLYLYRVCAWLFICGIKLYHLEVSIQSNFAQLPFWLSQNSCGIYKKKNKR